MNEKLALLAEQVARIEAETGGNTETLPPVPLGAEAIDAALPGGGLARGAVHELLGPEHTGDQRGDGALMGFAALALARLMAADEAGRPVLWCENRKLQHIGGLLCGEFYGPGIAAMGVPVGRVLLAQTKDDAETLWAMEEGVRSGAVAVVVGELTSLDPRAARRLQLAAQASQTTALALRPGRDSTGASFAETRWRLSAIPSLGGPPVPHWRVNLLRTRRGSAGGEWLVRWQDGTLVLLPPTHVFQLATTAEMSMVAGKGPA